MGASLESGPSTDLRPRKISLDEVQLRPGDLLQKQHPMFLSLPDLPKRREETAARAHVVGRQSRSRPGRSTPLFLRRSITQALASCSRSAFTIRFWNTIPLYSALCVFGPADHIVGKLFFQIPRMFGWSSFSTFSFPRRVFLSFLPMFGPNVSR